MKLFTLLTLTAFTLANVKVQDTSNNSVDFGSKVGSFMGTERAGSVVEDMPINVIVTGGAKKAMKKTMMMENPLEMIEPKLRGGMPSDSYSKMGPDAVTGSSGGDGSELSGNVITRCRGHCTYSKRCCIYSFCRRSPFCRRP